MKANQSEKRKQEIQRLSEKQLDVLVVGGGITGSGTARDAAMRGLHTAIIDRYDFAFGTSSRSSRLLHGGIRYLEQGRVGLVHEASVEKKTLAHIAPHLGEPLGFMFPVFKKAGRPMWQMRIGVKIYDLLCGGRNFKPSEGFSKEETLSMLPSLGTDGLRGAVRYFDALTCDARLVVDTLRSAQKAGAIVTNYTRLIDARREGGVWVCQVEDTLAGRTFTVKARTIVNATGPWAEQVPHSSVKLRLSKGIHMVVDRKRLPVKDAVVICEGKRILFIIPWGERLIIGTTDTDYKGKPEDVKVAREDIMYVLKTVKESFPTVNLSEKDVISAWAGLRPLIANPDGTPSDISRAHQIISPEQGWWDVAGGKLTTYRLMAEQTVDQLIRFLGAQKVACRTAKESLLTPSETQGVSGTVPPAVTRKAVEHYVNNEWAIHLDDVLIRRSGWHYYRADGSVPVAQVADWMADLCGWTPAEREQEVTRYNEAASLEKA